MIFPTILLILSTFLPSAHLLFIGNETDATFEKNQTLNETEENFSYAFQVQLELKVTKIEEPLVEIEERLNKLVQSSFMLANYKHRKENLPKDFDMPNSDYRTKIIKKRVADDVTYLHFITYSSTGKPIAGEVIADDLNQLSATQISATLHYPINRVISNRDIENNSGFRWWFLAGILGIGVIVFLIGWLILFIYFNTCGASKRNADGDYLTPAQRAQMKKGIIINPSPPWARGIYDHPLGEPWVDPGSSKADSSENNKKQPKYKRSFRTLSEAQLEKRLKEEREAIVEAISNMRHNFKKSAENASTSTPTTSSTDTDNNQEKTSSASASSSSKNKKRSTIFPVKIGPMNDTTAVAAAEAANTNTNTNTKTTSIMDKKKKMRRKENEQPKETSEISHENENSDENKNNKKNNNGDIKSEPESDYGSTTTEEDDKKLRIITISSGRNSRPMTARKQRTSCFEKETDDEKPQEISKVWTPYLAADVVANNFWNNNNPEHVRPSSPTMNGIVEVKSKY